MNKNYPTFLNKRGFLLLFFLSLGFCTMAQKPMETRPFEISLAQDEIINSSIVNNERIDAKTGLPIAIYGMDFEVPEGTPESQAMYYLELESKVLGISKEEITNFQHYATRTSDAGSVVRYRQYYQGYPVNKAELTITISPQNKVVMVMSSYRPNISLTDVNPTVSQEEAYHIAMNLLNPDQVTFYNNKLMVYNNNKITRLSHEVVIAASNPVGEWHVFVDAKSGEIFKAVDEACYYSEKDKDKDRDKRKTQTNSTTINSAMMINGTGMVFNPDPLSSNQVVYGTSGYVDGNDANTTQLNNARFSVALNDITFSGGMYSLVGPRAQIIDFDPPTTGLFAQASPDFSFTRQDQGFEAVNAYYHIDYLMNYINNDLGVSAMPYQYVGGVRYDPHGASGADNSYYQGGPGRLSFGEGCVDDAEDSDVIHHELGHGLHDWVTLGGLSQVDGLSEGCGDYVAQSYNRGLGNWSSGNPQYNWVFNWDGHNSCWAGRTTAYGASYPGGLVGQIHTDGQIWATCLMGIWNQIGQQQMDKIFYEGLAMTNGSASQNDAANGVYQAAINLSYSEADLITIHTSLTNCGYTLPDLPGPPTAAFSAGTPTICLDTNNTVNFYDETSPFGTSWLWTFEGGTPSTSTSQNPTVTYSAAGTYDVTLEVTNSYGTDTIYLPDYVTVLQGQNCPSCANVSNTTSVPISASGAGNTYYSTINYGSSGEITDVNVTLNINHTYDEDLVISLTSPMGTTVLLTSSNGGSGDNYINTTFDQEASNSITSGSPPFTGTFVPEGNLSTLNGQDAMGDWVLTIVDQYNLDGGQLNSWSLDICTAPQLSTDEFLFGNLVVYPNPNDGTFGVKMTNSEVEDVTIQVFDIRGRSIFEKSYELQFDFNQTIDLGDVKSGMYMLKISSNDKYVIKKIIVD